MARNPPYPTHVGPRESSTKSWQARFLPKRARDQGYHQALRDPDAGWLVRYNSNSAFRPERLDPGEVLKAHAPRGDISDHLIEADTKFLHCGKYCRERANNLHCRLC
jgi:hypothetical protein